MISIGAYAPLKLLTNADLEQMVNTSDEWITQRTGIKTRHIAASDEAASDLAVKAAQVALERADRRVSDIDMIIVASLSGDYLFMPSTACMVAKKLGARNIPAFDVLAACSGFVYALSTARAYIESGAAATILVIGTEAVSRFIDYTDRTTCVLFGDGAGAAVLTATDDQRLSVLDVKISSDGEFSDFLCIPCGGSKNPLQRIASAEYSQFLHMKGNETFKLAVRTLSQDVVEILERNHLSAADITHFIPHQANLRIIKAVGLTLKLRDDQIVLTIERFGNTSAASIPMAINAAYEDGRLKTGDLMLLDAFGGGLTWGSALAYFAGK